MNDLEKKNLAKELEKYISKDDIFIDEPMSKHTSIKIGGPADVYAKLKSIENISKILKIVKEKNIPITILGNGTNILVKDNGIRGLVIRICDESYKMISDTEIEVSSGMLNAKLARILQEKELTGFEFASGIPGTIGGAIRMNAGAYGGQMQDIVKSTKYIDLDDLEVKELKNSEQQFSYRKSIFSDGNKAILSAVLKFTKGSKEEIQNKMNDNLMQRKEKQPIDKPSAGSTFKRGSDFITAKLIDECGLKGYKIGGAAISEKHAGFVVNLGGATAKDVLELCDIIKKTVYEKFRKEIELEVEVLGE